MKSGLWSMFVISTYDLSSSLGIVDLFVFFISRPLKFKLWSLGISFISVSGFLIFASSLSVLAIYYITWLLTLRVLFMPVPFPPTVVDGTVLSFPLMASLYNFFGNIDSVIWFACFSIDFVTLEFFISMSNILIFCYYWSAAIAYRFNYE